MCHLFQLFIAFQNLFLDYNKHQKKCKEKLMTLNGCNSSINQLLDIPTDNSLAYIHLEQGFLTSTLLVVGPENSLFGKLHWAESSV